ncbi:hypothetical protein AYI69_g10056 [Smittium culicis]|uniref:RING-type domain-containing protein n=1 Tax=Smittium culicis TaxID=133412 RepID=A0A1R1X8D5_9FUNG|nr:hypothetical protein AYI69_g10056 [Smittium culicis]
MDTLWSAQRQNIPPFQADNDVCPICHSDRYLNQSMKLFLKGVQRLPRECGGHYVQAAQQRERARGRGRDTQVHANEQGADRS